jgi:endoglucanase
MATAKKIGKRLTLAMTLIFCASSLAYADTDICKDWPLWSAYQKRFVQADGRVLDQTGVRDFTTSESEAYTLFFTLVSNDRQRFDLVLNWIQANLAQGELARHLPAWQWGRQSTGKWEILDHNSASDADMWLAYTLLQAGSLWTEARLTSLGMAVLEQIKAKELVMLPDVGMMVLPAPEGFADANGKWRLNPSYQAIQILRAFANADPKGPWNEIALNTRRLIQSVSPRGYAPDWASFQTGEGWRGYPENEAVGSYDAIRIYMWAGMLNDSDSIKPILLRSLTGMRSYVLKNKGALMEKVNTQTGAAEGIAPRGFSAALLPYLQSLNESKLLAQQLQRLNEKKYGTLIGESSAYYDQILSLFGQGWIDQRFSFSQTGQLIPAWFERCRIQ